MNAVEQYANSQFDLDSFYAYCYKYQISRPSQRAILNAFYKNKPNLVVLERKYAWQETGSHGFRFKSSESVIITIELFNYPKLNNVTYIGFS